MAGSLDSVRQKIFRAKVHFVELQAELSRYFQTNPGKVMREAEGDPNQYIGTFQAGGPIPARLPIIIGDCLQNLRSSLDYLVWELVLAAKNTPGRHNMFPVCKTLEAFNNQITKQPSGHGLQMGMNSNIVVFVAFNEGAAQNLEVGLVLGEMLKYIRFTVLPRFERFFV